ncbi:unnamed protein product [Candidula unifasciata]|uniref:G-protein coupled receptors family 1 profile domain-containing protein n=1 Tax=Candidula unifasciata TaxID=100452 RepID=A0A8S4A4E2_9EUPU|nr:unnamed protein product [Candidula unifasciata]
MDLATRETDVGDVATVNQIVSTKQVGKIVTDDAIFYFKTCFLILLGALSSMGVTTNIMNITVYWKQGIRDSINITFMALSMWDLNTCLMSGLSAVSNILEIYVPGSDVSFIAIQYVYFGYTRGFMYVLSTLVTSYLSLERSICIMFPFKVKSIFTAGRVVLINFITALFGLVCYCPAWATQGVQWVFNPKNNRTRLVYWLSENRRDIDLFVDTFNGMVLPLLAQLLITISAVFMIHGVQKSAKFRNQTVDIKTPVISTSNREPPPISNASLSLKKSKIMTSKDIRLTKVVILITIIFFACNLPVFVVAFLRWLIPDLDIGKPQQNLYAVLYAFVYLFGVINSSVNIFVYYNVGTKYRQEFLRLVHSIACVLKKQ